MINPARTRRAQLKRWALSRDLVNISEWSRRVDVSYPTAKRDFSALAQMGCRVEPFKQGSKVMGYQVTEVI